MVVPRQSSCVSGRGLLLPGLEGIGPDRTIGIGCKSVSARMEVAIDERVGGEKVLGLPG
jgi:hypothetical protein